MKKAYGILFFANVLALLLLIYRFISGIDHHNSPLVLAFLMILMIAAAMALSLLLTQHTQVKDNKGKSLPE